MKQFFSVLIFIVPIFSYCCDDRKALQLPSLVGSFKMPLDDEECRPLLEGKQHFICEGAKNIDSEEDQEEYLEQKLLLVAEIKKKSEGFQKTVEEEFEHVRRKIAACLDCNAMAVLVLKLLNQKQELDKERAEFRAQPRFYEQYNMIMWDLGILEKIIAFCPDCSSLLLESKEEERV